jgi:ABC-type branched-subunit amino acid transport system substrate-binding protein
MKKIYLFLIISIFLYLPFDVEASNIKSIKLAIFDNPQIDSSNIKASKKLEEAYTQGVATAAYAAKKKGFNIDFKYFFYGSNLLNIVQQIPNINSWSPDVIMGLHTSNSALMSKTYFTDRLVLSITASDSELMKSPPNFYSLGTPDPYVAKQLVKFISRNYPNRNVFIIIGAESKESISFGRLVTSLYEKKNPKQTVRQARFLSDDINTMNASSLLKNYHQGDIILLFAIAGTYNTQIYLMNKIADFLAPNKLIFITPVDNWQGKDMLANVSNTKNPYVAFRLDSLYVNDESQEYKAFMSNYEELYHTRPIANISYFTYRSVMSIWAAIEKYPPPSKLSTQEATLWSYQQALKKNPNWFRPMAVVLYKLENNKEVFFERLN